MELAYDSDPSSDTPISALQTMNGLEVLLISVKGLVY